MRASVTDVLAVPAVRSADPEVLGGEDYLAQRVRWLHTTDGTNLSGLLKGGEMILTAGETFTADHESAVTYFKNLVENGASGVMVSLLNSDVSAKSVLRSAAQTAGLPVILLRDRVPFVELTEAVHRVLLAVDSAEGSESDPVFLIDHLSVEQAMPSEVLRRASELLIAPVVYEDHHHRVVAYATAGMPSERLLANWQDYSRGVPATSHQSGDGWMQVAYKEGGETVGRLIVPMQLTDPIAPIVLERTAQVLEHCFANLDEIAGRQYRAEAAAFEELRELRLRQEAPARVRASASGVYAAAVYFPLVLRPADLGPGTGAGQRALRETSSRVRKVAQRLALTLISGPLTDKALGMVLAMPDEKTARTQLHTFAAALDQEHGGSLSGGVDVLALGVGGPLLHEVIAEGIDEAWEIAVAAQGMGPRAAALVAAGDVRLRRLLQAMSDEPRLREFVDESLAAIHAEDTDYLRTLRSYIELNGNIAEVARALFLSRPSVYARLNRIEEILGVSLSNVDTRTGLYVALLAVGQWDTRSRDTL